MPALSEALVIYVSSHMVALHEKGDKDISTEFRVGLIVITVIIGKEEQLHEMHHTFSMGE